MGALGERKETASLSTDFLERAFPGLRNTPYGITSPQTPKYNCIAWAADDFGRWWWPKIPYYWPSGIPFEETLDAFVLAFATLGYVRCLSGEHEVGIEKVAIYVNPSGIPTHAARQLGTGMWTSKLGREHDIVHTLDGLAGQHYGRVGAFMSRPKA